MNPTKTTLDRPVRAPARKQDKRAARRPVEEPIAQPIVQPIAQPVTQPIVERDGAVTGLSDAWFSMARSGQDHSLQAARQFIELVDTVLPLQGGEDSHRRRLIDGAFDLADRVGAAELGLMRSAVRSAVIFDVDVNVNVDTDVDAFNGTDVDVTVPTRVLAL